MKKATKRKIIISIIAISVLLISAYLLFEANKPPEDIIPLREYEVSRDDITAGIFADGYLFLSQVFHLA